MKQRDDEPVKYGVEVSRLTNDRFDGSASHRQLAFIHTKHKLWVNNNRKYCNYCNYFGDEHFKNQSPFHA